MDQNEGRKMVQNVDLPSDINCTLCVRAGSMQNGRKYPSIFPTSIAPSFVPNVETGGWFRRCLLNHSCLMCVAAPNNSNAGRKCRRSPKNLVKRFKASEGVK